MSDIPVPDPNDNPAPPAPTPTPTPAPSAAAFTNATYLVGLAKSFGSTEVGHQAVVQALEEILKVIQPST